jgi:hypothetical protein
MTKVEISSIIHDHRRYVAETDRGQLVIKDNLIVQGEDICKAILKEGVTSKQSMKDPLHALYNRINRVVKKDLDANYSIDVEREV